MNKIHLISLLDIKGEFSPIHMKLVGKDESPFRRLEALPTSSGTDAAEYKRLQVAEHPAHIQPIIQIASVHSLVQVGRVYHLFSVYVSTFATVHSV